MININRLADNSFEDKHWVELIPSICLYMETMDNGEAKYKIDIIKTCENLCRGEGPFPDVVTDFELCLDSIKECLILSILCYHKMTKDRFRSRQRVRWYQHLMKTNIHTKEHEKYVNLNKMSVLDLYEDFLRYRKTHEHKQIT